MSTREPQRPDRNDAGFSLVEIVVALGLLMVVLTASLPLLLSMLQSTVTTRLNTQAKNLSQERLEQLTSLRFQVDRQNGPFLDLLDLYYTNATSTSPVTVVGTGTGTLTGRYRATGTSNGVAAPLYEVSTGPLPGATQFEQVVLAQYIGADGAVLPAARYQDRYDSQVVGRDASPSLMVRFTVVTSWRQAGKLKTFRTTTAITDGRPELPVIQTQAKAVAVSVGSTGADGATLQLQAGVSSLDGGQSSGSSVSGYVAGALATRSGQPDVTGRVGQFALPGQAVTSSGSGAAQDGGSCAWYAFGPNGVSNLTADVSAGLPRAPLDVDAGSPPNVVTGSVDQGSSNACGLLSFDNLVGGGAARGSSDALGRHMGAAPYIRVPDTATSGAGVAGSGYVTATPLTATPRQAKAGARVAVSQPLVLFPNNPDAGGRGLVSATVTVASVDCISGTATTSGSGVGAYDLTLGWWGRGSADATSRWHSATWRYRSDAATPLTVTGDVWEPATTDLGDGTLLSQLVQLTVPSATEGVVTTGAARGLRGFPSGILTMTTAPTLVNEIAAQPGHSAIRVQVGQLTCVADDLR